MAFDRDSVSADDIRQLREEAGAHGDYAQTRLCERALDGDAVALELCIDAIEAARVADTD